MKRLRVGIIGLGVGERHIAGYEADPRCEVVSLVDQDPVKLADVLARHPGKQGHADASAVLEDPTIDVVSVASYDGDHADQVVRALDAGKHVFVEKPLCTTGSELERICVALERNPTRLLSSNLILRRTPRFARLRERIREGAMGRIYHLEGDYNYGRIEKILEGWRGRQPFYSVMHGGGIHLIDLLTWLIGERPIEVAAYGNRIATEGTRFHFNDCVSALLRFPSGPTAKVTANFACVMPHTHLLSVYGTKASFVQGPTGEAHFFTSRDPAVAPARVEEAYPGAAKGDLIPGFIAAILDGTPLEVATADVLDCMAVSIAIETAATLGKPVRVRY